ncbi:MAG: tetratricopeptide repeat protein [Erythrobacter sp.]
MRLIEETKEGNRQMMPTIAPPAHVTTPDKAPSFLRAVGLAAFAAAMVVTAPAPAAAQDTVDEARLRKIEAEIRALQRNVFPGGDGRYFEPQITSGSGSTSGTGGRTSGPSTTAVTDILARLDAIELQLQRITSRTEENSNAITLLSERVAVVETSGAPTLGMTETRADDEDTNATDANLTAMGAGTGAETDTDTDTDPEPAGPTAERLAAVQAITKPQTDDAADDEYSYGFRLWNAGFYPEARQQLSSFVESYPNHWRLTYGRNLLGRAYLDDGKAEDAARWFLKNYQGDKTAARAPDSLLYLAESMIALGDTRRACIALAEFGETYPAVASGRLMDKYEGNRRRVTCEG